MSEDTTTQAPAPEPEPRIDPIQLQFAIEQLRSHQNLLGGALAGAAGAAVGAGLWAGVTVATGYQIGWIAVGIGFGVGFAVRAAGKGIDRVFGYLGAGLALLGCAVGNLLAVCGIVAKQEEIPFLDLLSQLDLAVIQELMVATFSPMDLLFYGIALYEGYKLSFRQLTQEELRTLLPGA